MILEGSAPDVVVTAVANQMTTALEQSNAGSFSPRPSNWRSG